MNAFGRAWRGAGGWLAKQYGRTMSFPHILGWNPSGVSTRTALGAATVARCIVIKSTMIAACPLVLEQRVGRGKWGRVDDDSSMWGRIAELLARPNVDQGLTEFWTLHHAGRYGFGRGYVLTDYVNGGQRVERGRAFPRELRILRGDLVEPVLSSDPRVFTPLHYRYCPEGGTPIELRPDEVVADRLPNYLNPLQGYSAAASVAVYALIEETLSKFHFGYFKNGARAGLVFETDTKLKHEELLRIKREWDEQHGNAVGKMFATVFLHSGMRLKEQQAGRKESDFPDLFRSSKEQIGMAHGIPPVFLGDFSNAALANIEEQTPILMESTLFPEAKTSEEQFNNHLIPRFDPLKKIRLRYAWEDTPAMKRRAITRIVSLVQATGTPILTVNEARERENLPPVAGGNVVMAPFSLSPLGTEPEPSKLLPEPDKSARHAKWIDEPERHVKRRRASTRMARFEPGAEKEMRRFIGNQEARVIASLGDGTKTVKGVVLKLTAAELFDEEFEAEITREILARIYARVLSVRGPEALEDVDAADATFLMDHRDVVEFLRANSYENGRLITGTTAERLREIVTASVSSGETIQDLTSSIHDLFTERRSEAQRIARTEVARSYNFATFEAWKQSGAVEEQEWLSAGDDAVRDAHRDMDGQSVAVGEPFILTADDGSKHTALYPGDPDLPASLSVNCRCAVLPRKRTAPPPEERDVRVGPTLAALFPKKSVDASPTLT